MKSADAEQRAKKITTVIFDVDGVLTDGGIYLGNDGEEMKRFNVLDGTGIKYLIRAGLKVGIISGRQSGAVNARAKELGIVDVYQGYSDKIKAYEDLKRLYDIADEQIAYMGDDLPDIPVIRRAGLVAAVANAHPKVKALAHYVTSAAGGEGAAREFAEWLLFALGRWDAIMARYQPHGGAGRA